MESYNHNDPRTISNDASSKTMQSTDRSKNSRNSSPNVSSANEVGTLHEFLNTSVIFSVLCNNSKGCVFFKSFKW